MSEEQRVLFREIRDDLNMFIGVLDNPNHTTTVEERAELEEYINVWEEQLALLKGKIDNVIRKRVDDGGNYA